MLGVSWRAIPIGALIQGRETSKPYAASLWPVLGPYESGKVIAETGANGKSTE
jgi:hypothetical protein